jgi:hypothetical protein
VQFSASYCSINSCFTAGKGTPGLKLPRREEEYRWKYVLSKKIRVGAAEGIDLI